MILDLTQLGLLIFILALFGYMAREFYNIGHYGPAYRPLGKGKSFDRTLQYSTQGFLLILFASFFYIGAVATGKIKIPEIVGSIPISKETSKNLIIYGYMYANVLWFVLVLAVISICLGWLTKYVAFGVIIETNDGKGANAS